MKPERNGSQVGEKPPSEYDQLGKKKTELEDKLHLLNKEEEILQENMRILEKKLEIQMLEEKVKAKQDAFSQLEAETTNTTS